MEIYGWIIEHTDILGLIIDFLSLLATIFLTIAIYLLERHHEKEREKAEEKAQKSAVIESAKNFLINNDNEIEYIPLAEIAAKLKIRRKHCRHLINRYLRCSEQQQQEILCQANIPDIQVSMDSVQTALKYLQADLNKYKFGRNILYDEAKYLHRAFERWSEVAVDDVNPYIFEDLLKSEWHGEQSGVSWRSSNCSTTLSSYMWDYLHPTEINIDRNRIKPPIDMVFQKCNLGYCEESTMTFWTMRIIIDACHTIKNEQYEDIFDEYLIQTQEDMYYYTLAVLCKTYAAGGDKQK
ncbi:MAG: hypothetical protein K2M73_01135 [Lachnospiraceae bacterium]|nr:hypothetical protein [Lachnospiraceae bacterium]